MEDVKKSMCLGFEVAKRALESKGFPANRFDAPVAPASVKTRLSQEAVAGPCAVYGSIDTTPALSSENKELVFAR